METDIKRAIQLSTEIKTICDFYRETLITMFDDDLIPLEIRQQYERLLLMRLKQEGFI